ncbi:MAG TPA: SUF system Fe-S cluster assembly protein [Capsulimonadaceae bacterium]|nr:SUF system Fe-S cluster assembly protein [Capsulimonadaceae bacterium]
MAFSKLLQQFTHGRQEADESASAKQVDSEVLTTQPDAGIDQVSTSPTQAAQSSGPKAPLNPIEIGVLEEEVIEAIRTCYDPEIPVNIFDLGLVYEVNVDKKAFVDIKMTLTSPGCPVAGTLPPEVENKVRLVDGVAGARVQVVWDPPWNMEMMSEEARLELGFY